MTVRQRKTLLDNGVRVVTETMPDVRSLAIGVVVDVGSKDETPDSRGLAHLIEHMLFRGTRLRDGATLARMIDTAGGQMGAFTTRDYTVLHAAVLDDYRTFALDIFGDMLRNPRFDPAALEREKTVIAQEIATGDEQPAKVALGALKRLAWGDHPLGQPIYGGAADVAKVSHAALLDFSRQYYTADRLIVAAAGHVEHRDFVAQVQDALWELPKSAAGAADPVAPRFQAGITLVAHPSAQVHFALGAPAPVYADPERYPAFLLTDILGGGLSSRLYRVLRDEQGWVYDIGATYHPYRDGGMLVIEGTTAPDTFLPVVQAVIGQMIDVQRTAVEAEELWRAQEHLRGEVLMGAESTNTRMSQLATQELYFGRFLPLAEVVTGIGAVTPDAVQTLAAQLFQPGALALAAVGPFADVSLTRTIVADLMGVN